MASLKATRAIALVAFAVAWFVPVEGSACSPWLRLLLALGLFSVPGILLQRLVLGEAAGRWSRQASLGFVLSTTLAGGLGLVASLFRLPFGFVAHGLFAAGCVLLLVAPFGPLPRLRVSRPPLVALVPMLVALLLAARLAIAPYVGDDDLAHMARIRFFASSSGLSFEDFIFGTQRLAAPRYWLSFWPLSNAVFMSRAGLTPMELLAVYLAPFLAIVALVALYELARSLGASHAKAGFAVVAQVACLLLTSLSDQPGGVFFNRLAEDKTSAAFVVAPVFLRLVADALETPHRRQLVGLALGGCALVFAHPTLLGMTCVVAAAFVLVGFFAARRRGALAVLALIVALPVVPASFRFVELGAHHRQFSIGEAEEAGELGENRLRRLSVRGDGLYAVSPEAYTDAPFALVGVATLLSAFRWRRDALARLVLAASLVILTTLVPWSAWLLGKAVTPFQIWRVLWLTPFGLACGVLAGVAAGLGPRLPALASAAFQILGLGLAAAHALAAPGHPFQSWPLPPDWRQRSYAIAEAGQSADACPRSYAELAATGQALERLLPEGGVVVGDPEINSFIPALAAQAHPLTFRTEAHSSLHGSFAPAQAAARFADWATLLDRSVTADARRSVLQRYQVRALLACGEAGWARKTQEAALGRIRKVGQFGSLRLFEVE